MTRKYLYGDGRFVAYGMEKCEEQLLIAYYHDIEPKIRPDAMWRNEFLDRFYRGGQGVSQASLNLVNGERRRLSLPEYTFRETQMIDYGKQPDRMLKAEWRRQYRDQYLDLDRNGKDDWIEKALDDVERQPEPHFTFDERTAYREPNLGGLSQSELRNRRGALMNNVAPIAPKKIVQKPNLSRQTRLLNIATKLDTVERIVTSLLPDEALQIAEDGEVNDPDVLDLLVNRSLDQAA